MFTTPKLRKAFSLFIAFMLPIVFAGCGEEKVEESAPVVRPVKTAIVGGGAAVTRNLPGTVQAAQQVELSFRVGGPLIEFPVNEGQKVAKGQLLARIDPRDYRIAQNKAKAEYVNAQADFDRYQKLYEKEAVPLSDLDLRRSKRDITNAQLEDAKANLNDTYLRAPFSGEIGDKHVENRQDVRAKQPVLSLHDVSGFEIVMDVPEAGRALFNPQSVNRAVATFEFAPGREFPVSLKEFSASADARTGTYRATVTLEKPKGVNIQPGMTATITVAGDIIEQKKPAQEASSQFVIPAAAVFAGDDGKQYVWVVDQNDMTLGQRLVEVGEVTGTGSIRVSSGLSAGEMIATAGVTQLREGMKIRPLE